MIAVGPGRRSEDSGEIIPMDVAKGDTVVYSKYGGTEITVEGEDLLILSGRDVLAKLGLIKVRVHSGSRPPPRFSPQGPARRPHSTFPHLRFEDSRGVPQSHAQDPEV